ncbi:hypothetical protein CGI00_05775 [Vibrio parahaemolyticus]|nr:hypothetical protein [Vibrio parahaemolyticus]EGQ9693909.1 hypothetical protein [Vibrio parahaemolyticus]EGR0690620.1 hypothetical protein [Vibrio parahaemolyticus]EGR1958293.1 hypothetical protein [Vibrio parahaemolyticus]EGR1967066.1 hypothetical protein [Vibrio parahaemolyticus]
MWFHKKLLDLLAQKMNCCFCFAVFPNRISRIERSVVQVKLIIFRNLIKLFDKFLARSKMNPIAYWGMFLRL